MDRGGWGGGWGQRSHQPPSQEETQVKMADESGSRDLQLRETLRALLSDSCRVVMVTGKPGYAKTTFARQLTRCLGSALTRQHGLRLVETLVTCQGVQTWSDVIGAFVTSFGLHQTQQCNPEVDVIDHVTRWPQLYPGTRLAVIVTHMEVTLSNDLDLGRRTLGFLGHLLDVAPWLCVVVTSDVEVTLGSGYHTHVVRLKALSQQEALLWLRRALPGWTCPVLLLQQLSRACQGRPGLLHCVIQHLRDVTVKENDVNNNYDVDELHDVRNGPTNRLATYAVTADDVREAFSTPRGVLRTLSSSPDPRERLDVTLRRQLTSLTPHLASSVLAFGNFGGPVPFNTARRVLRHASQSELKLQTLLPLARRHLVDVDWTKGQVTLDSFVAALLEDQGGMAAFPGVERGQLLLRCTLGRMLQSLERPLVAKSRGRMVDYRFHDYEGLLELIKTAINSNAPFQDVMKVLQEEEGAVLTRCCGVRALDLLSYVISSAATQGTPFQRHFLNGLLAAAMTEVQGDRMAEAAGLLRETVAGLAGHGYHLMLFRRLLGWTQIRRGDNVDAERLLLQAASTPVPPHCLHRARLQRLQIASHRAIVANFLDKGQEAMALVRDSLPQAASLQPHHPIVAVLLNSLGITYERQGNFEKALEYYQKSLSLRRHFAEENPGYLVVSLSNTANLLMQRGHFDQAVRLLLEALEVRRRLNWHDYNTALCLFYLGNAYALAGQYREASRQLREAEALILRVAPAHSALTHVRCVLAHCHMALDSLPEALEVLDSAVRAGGTRHMVRDQGFLHALQLRYLVATSPAQPEVVPGSASMRSEVLDELHRLVGVWREVKGQGAESTLCRLQESLEAWTAATPSPLSLLGTDGCSLCRHRRLTGATGRGSSGCPAGTTSPGHRGTAESQPPPPAHPEPAMPCCPGRVGRPAGQAENSGRRQDACRNCGALCDAERLLGHLGARPGERQTRAGKELGGARRYGGGELHSGQMFGLGEDEADPAAGDVSSLESLSDFLMEDRQEGFPELTESKQFDDVSTEVDPVCQHRELYRDHVHDCQNVKCDDRHQLKHGCMMVSKRTEKGTREIMLAGDSQNTHLVGRERKDCYALPWQNEMIGEHRCADMNRCADVNRCGTENKGVSQKNCSHATPKDSGLYSPDHLTGSSHPQPPWRASQTAGTSGPDLLRCEASRTSDAVDVTRESRRHPEWRRVPSPVQSDKADAGNTKEHSGSAGQAQCGPSGSSVELSGSLSLLEGAWLTEDEEEEEDRSSLHSQLCQHALLTLSASPPERPRLATAAPPGPVAPTSPAAAVARSGSSGQTARGISRDAATQDSSGQELPSGLHGLQRAPGQEDVKRASKPPSRPKLCDWSLGQQPVIPPSPGTQVAANHAVMGSSARKITLEGETTLADRLWVSPDNRRNYEHQFSGLRARGVGASLTAATGDRAGAGGVGPSGPALPDFSKLGVQPLFQSPPVRVSASNSSP